MREQEKNIFEQQMQRIRRATGSRTQIELAAFLGVGQAAIADAERRRMVPDNWLVTLSRIANIYPEWILSGNGPCRFPVGTKAGTYETGDTVHVRHLMQESLRAFTAKELADELLRRIAQHPDPPCR